MHFLLFQQLHTLTTNFHIFRQTYTTGNLQQQIKVCPLNTVYIIVALTCKNKLIHVHGAVSGLHCSILNWAVVFTVVLSAVLNVSRSSSLRVYSYCCGVAAILYIDCNAMPRTGG